MDYEEAKEFLLTYVQKLSEGKTPDKFTSLFDEFADAPPCSTGDLYDYFNVSPRQCQRLFLKHFGITPKKVIAILRFQHSLRLLTEAEQEIEDIQYELNYYDQAHFTKDFKRHLGLTPKELIQKYRNMK